MAGGVLTAEQKASTTDSDNLYEKQLEIKGLARRALVLQGLGLCMAQSVSLLGAARLTHRHHRKAIFFAVIYAFN